MDYLKEYGLTTEQINEIEQVIINMNLNVDNFIYNPEKISEILNIFKEIGVNNYYEILINAPALFFDTVKSIKLRIDSYGDKYELARLINEDAHNLVLADLL